jgi:hypothetical protein
MLRDHNLHQKYGKGLDWTGYSVYDAATCLLRYLKRLPEPVIPYDLYNKFTPILGPTVYENDLDLNCRKASQVHGHELRTRYDQKISSHILPVQCVNGNSRRLMINTPFSST